MGCNGAIKLTGDSFLFERDTRKILGRLLAELFLPSLLLASRQRLSSEMRTQSKFASKFGDVLDSVADTKKDLN